MPSTRLSPRPPIPVIYVIGSGRSGSTLLGQLLGGHSEVFYAGEAYNYRNSHLHARAGRERWCSCGEPVYGCAFWQRVRDRLAGEWGDPLLDLKDRDPATFSARNASLFRALQAESGCRVIVDASKRHYRLNLLLQSPEFEVTIVHLVRDARAYGQSVLDTLEKKNQPASTYPAKMWNWQLKNLAMRALFSRKPRYELVRYEELAAAPNRVLARILGHVGLALEDGQLDREKHDFHDFSGNLRTRLRSVRPVQLETGYLDTLGPRRWALGTALAAPALAAFGYPMRRTSTRRHLDSLDLRLSPSASPPRDGRIRARIRARIRVLYILCKGRSGSTLTGLLLGAHPDVAPVGEIAALDRWIRRVQNGDIPTCTCGEPFPTCDFWHGMKERLGETWSAETDLRSDDPETFRRDNLAVFRAALAQTGAHIVLDKSKKLSRALRLAALGEIDLTVLHIVRDPRAVAHSFRQRGVRQKESGVLRYNFYKNVARWAWLNAAMPARMAGHPRYHRVRYEDIIRDPRQVLAPVLREAGLDWHPSMDDFGNVRQHTLGGNRMRLSGVREIRADTRYLHEVSAPEWLLGTAMALPTLLAHGYRVSRGGAAKAATPENS